MAAVRTRIAAHPERHQQLPTAPNYRQAIVDVFPFVEFYRIDEVRRTLVVVAIAHKLREPGYWKARVEP